MSVHRSNTTAPADSHPAEHGLAELASLVQGLETGPTGAELAHVQRLVEARLGMASSLFAALRAKHPASAMHCLRVAVNCSAWATAMKLPNDQREPLEVAALLHDVGKVGVPDQVLLKPERLTGAEVHAMERQQFTGLEILSYCCLSQQVFDTVRYSSAWFDGSRPGFDRVGDQLPLAARMLAIADAFDSMTTDHVYRPALSLERTVAELFDFAGRQFDPQLVQHFCESLANGWEGYEASVAGKWLRELHPGVTNSMWGMGESIATPEAAGVDSLFHRQLLETMHDGVVFVDGSLQIKHWNRGAQRLTGITPQAVAGKMWLPSLVGLRDEQGQPIEDADCPVLKVIESGVQNMRRISIQGRGGVALSVDLHVMPVVGSDGTRHGATLTLHDSSSEAHLEERVQSLYERATHDPLTKVANRAEFDRAHRQLLETHLKKRRPFSLVICDIDHFKRINDNFGHQAGDEVLVSFAAMLKRHAHAEDLAARYGGEEFVLLFSDCNVAEATRRAESLRRELEKTPHKMLSGRCITASFGVTELQPGDSAETMLSRSDRALLSAKDQGRNRVMQLGAGGELESMEPPEKRSWWPNWLRLPKAGPAVELRTMLVTPVPFDMAVQKLRGFIADHKARVGSISGDHVVMHLNGACAHLQRRNADRALPFTIEVTMLKPNERAGRPTGRGATQTYAEVLIKPARTRDRRRGDTEDRARQMLASLKSYLMAQEFDPASI